MSWLNKLMPSRIRIGEPSHSKRNVPEGLWTRCERCATVLYRPELLQNLNVCGACGHHMAMSARLRLDSFLDHASFVEVGAALAPADPLRFKDSKKYRDRLLAAQQQTGERDALIAGRGTLHAIPVAAAAFEFGFMGGSMGSVVGERFTLAAELAADEGRPLICFSATGGARMQEGLYSLLQMAKTAAALGRMRRAGVPYVSVLTHPTTGGVSASLGTLGDLNVAEPGALIGFAGPRVIEQTVRETLPEGFQRSEFLLEKGAVDMIVDRREQRQKLAELLAIMLRLPPLAAAVATPDTA